MLGALLSDTPITNALKSKWSSEMWTLTVAVGNIPWALMFKTEESANVAVKTINTKFGDGNAIYVADDFGQQGFFFPSAIGGYMLEDMNKSKLAHIERALHHARMQHEGQKLAQADAVLRMGNAGPAILQPGFGNGGFPRQ